MGEPKSLGSLIIPLAFDAGRQRFMDSESWLRGRVLHRSREYRRPAFNAGGRSWVSLRAPLTFRLTHDPPGIRC